MSVRSILEIVLHVESFRNIDLFYQGLYFLKFNIYMENNDQVNFFLSIFKNNDINRNRKYLLIPIV